MPDAIATALGITPQGDVARDRHRRRGRRRPAPAAGGRQLRARPRRPPRRPSARSSLAPTTAKVLATSREHLRVAGETLVSGVAARARRRRDLRCGHAVRRAGPRRAPGLRDLHDAATAAAVIEICETLDGLPLGIELAAARMAAMSATEVRDRLGDRFRLLDRSGVRAGAPADPAARGRLVVRPVERRRARRCCAPRRSSPAASTSPALCAVVDDADEVDVLGLLDSLVRKSLVVAHHAAARTRYSLFETIRQFAEDRLAETGAARAHARPARGALRGARPRPAGSAGTGPAGATPSTGWTPSSPTCGPRFRWSPWPRRAGRSPPTSRPTRR